MKKQKLTRRMVNIYWRFHQPNRRYYRRDYRNHKKTILFDGQLIEYEFTSNENFEINNPIEDLEVFNITYFDIETCTKTDLVLVSQINYLSVYFLESLTLPPNSGIPCKLTMTCTK